MRKKKSVMEISGRRKFAVRLKGKEAEGRKPMAVIGLENEVRGAANTLVTMVYGEPLEFELEQIPFSEAAANNC